MDWRVEAYRKINRSSTNVGRNACWIVLTHAAEEELEAVRYGGAAH
jgi:hypothetical protein